MLGEIPTILVDFLTIALTSISGFYVYRQSGKYHPELKTLLILVHLFFGGVIVLEILRNFISGSSFMFYYTVGGTSFVLWDVELLTIVACLIYIRPLTSGVTRLNLSYTPSQVRRTDFAPGHYFDRRDQPLPRDFETLFSRHRSQFVRCSR